jgi:hypothetical protein
MPKYEQMEVLILVKAAPVMTADLNEMMCVAGVRVDGGRNQWVRLHPVPFRDLANESHFAKYQRITVTCIRHRTDRRPETWTPIEGSIVLGETINPSRGWERRRQFIEGLGEKTACDLYEQTRKLGSGPGITSLAVVRPAEPPRVLIDMRDPAQLGRWQERADAAAANPSLFDDPTATRPGFEVVPWRFRYDYHCGAARCNGHQQTIVDWEAVSLWRNVRSRADWQAAIREKFERQMWAGRDTVLFLGNQEEHPSSFLVLGVFWPPAGPSQRVLL